MFKSIEAIRLRIKSFGSKLRRIQASISSLKLDLMRPWFSMSSANEFNKRQLAERAFNEALSRPPIVR